MGVEVKWWDSITVEECVCPVGLVMRALDCVGCIDSVDVVVW